MISKISGWPASERTARPIVSSSFRAGMMTETVWSGFMAISRYRSDGRGSNAGSRGTGNTGYYRRSKPRKRTMKGKILGGLGFAGGSGGAVRFRHAHLPAGRAQHRRTHGSGFRTGVGRQGHAPLGLARQGRGAGFLGVLVPALRRRDAGADCPAPRHFPARRHGTGHQPG